MLALHCQRSTFAGPCRAVRPRTFGPRTALAWRQPRLSPSWAPSVSSQSIDPLANRTVYEPGFTMPIHSEKQLGEFVNDGSSKLVVVMCKSSHCKPCKAFMQTYHQFAERFADCILLEVVGDESPELRKLMKTWEVKVTPTFRIHRDGKLIETVTGTGNSKLLKAILSHLKEGERGREWVDVTHEDLSQSLTE